jgi:hypothetical protein
MGRISWRRARRLGLPHNLNRHGPQRGCLTLFDVPFKPCLKRNKLRQASGVKSSCGRAEVQKPGSPTSQTYPHTRFSTS